MQWQLQQPTGGPLWPWWALIPPKVSHLSLWEALSQWWGGQALVGSSSPLPPGCSSLLCLRQSFKEDKMSLITSCAHSGLHGGVLATSWVCILDGRGPLILLWRSSTLPAGQQMCPPLGPDLGDHASGLQQNNLSVSFCLDSAVCTNILWGMNRQCGPLTSH